MAAASIPNRLPRTIKHAFRILIFLTSLIINHIGCTNVLSNIRRLSRFHLNDVLEDGHEELLKQYRELKSGDRKEARHRSRLGVHPNLGVPESINVLNDRLNMRVVGRHLTEAFKNGLHKIVLICLHKSAISKHSTSICLDVNAMALFVRLIQLIEMIIQRSRSFLLESTKGTARLNIPIIISLCSRFVEPAHFVSTIFSTHYSPIPLYNCIF